MAIECAEVVRRGDVVTDSVRRSVARLAPTHRERCVRCGRIERVARLHTGRAYCAKCAPARALGSDRGRVERSRLRAKFDQIERDAIRTRLASLAR
jgi:hypothetical protein